MPGELQIEAGRDYEVIADGVALHGTEQPHSGFTRDTVVVLTKGDVITCTKVAGPPQDRLYWSNVAMLMGVSTVQQDRLWNWY
jgi:hypothetical protein